MSSTATGHDQDSDPGDHLVRSQHMLARSEASQPGDHWCPLLAAGVLQSREYAAAVLGWCAVFTAHQLAEALDAQMHRADLVRRTTGVPQRYALTHYAAHRPLVADAAMDAQLRHIGEMAALDHIQVRVVPAHAPLAWASPFTVRGGRKYMEVPGGWFAVPGAERAAGVFEELWAAGEPWPRP
ncbi:Scr1 family TA system antitoxin-like transcriptional regulator [Nocardiopsis sp. NPDC006198]|uniref:Scr1 family TA system antitoxin-like transcriptional regulator n=1 Tax=Nocardiopsis sp. NPDC006198 TaxID=3154472 RepID=UPI0033B8DE1F